MRSKTTLFILAVIAIITTVLFLNKQESDVEKLRKVHTEFLESHPYNETLKLSKTERKNLGVPPNKYFEEQYLLEMNPATGRPDFEKKLVLQERLNRNRLQKNVPGTDANAWVERGPNNVAARTRAMLFDPNDNTNKRVFAGGVSGGLWVNDDITNSNSSWTRVGIPENLAVSSITVDPNNSQIMYLGTGESYVQGQVNGNGIYKSTNGGSTWSKVFGLDQGIAFFNGGSKVTINSPGSIAGDIVAVLASFGPAFSSAITGNLVLVNDGSTSPTEGCNTLTNGAAINGKIAVVERGSCNFTIKVKNAQDQGATAVVVINNVDGNPFAMAGTDATITIPSVMISKADGATILSTLQSQTVNATLNENGTNLPTGVTIVPGIFHVNDIVTRNNGGTTEIYAAVADAIYREAPGTLLGDGSEYGLYKSVDGGTSWGKLALPTTVNGNPYEPNDIEIASDNTIWMSTTSSSSFGDGGGSIFSSSNGSAFIKKYEVANASRTEIEVSGTNANKIYVLAQTGTVTILKTENGFATTPATMTLPDDADNGIPANDFTRGQAFYDLMIESDPTNDNIVYVGGIDTFRSIDGGASWVQISKWSNNTSLNLLTVPFVHADIHELLFDPSNSDKAIISTDGGVYYANSLAGAESTTTAIFSSNNGYNTSQFYWAAIGQSILNDQFVGGTQDNGSPFVNAASPNIDQFLEVSGGDGAYSFIDKDGAYMITAFTNNSYTRFNLPFGGIFSGVTIESSSDGAFINPAELDDNLDILYSNATSNVAFQISRFTNLTSSSPIRTDFTNPLLNRPVTALKVSPYTSGSSRLFVGTDAGRLLKISNANTSPSWIDISGPEFLGSISAINFGANENEILVTFHNYGVKSVWFTVDAGASWQNKEGNFPDIPVKAIMMNPLLNDEVIIGTDLGVWRTSNFKDTNPTWAQSQNGMQNVKVTSFDLRTADNTILASTYGRGLFTGKFTDQALSVQDISVDNNFSVFPNPSNGDVKIRAARDFGASTITVYDVNGRLVHSKEINLTGTVPIDMNNLKSGLYIMKIQGENFAYSNKLIIE